MMNEKVNRRLIIEAKVSAGPRKSRDKYEDYGSDLCEDCAGYISYKEFTIFWICDGTGDSSELPKRAYLPGFSVRILAQDLGEGFGNRLVNVLANGVDPCIVNMGTEVIDGVAGNWRKRLIEYVGDVEKKGELQELLKAMPLMVNGSWRLKWSSTFLGGVYNDRQGTLALVNIGDSGALVIGGESGIVNPNKKRIILAGTFSQKNGTVTVDVATSEVCGHWKEYNGVKYFLAVSDGAARDLKGLLHDVENNLRSMSVEETSRRLLMRRELTYETYDDRAIVVGRLVPE